MNSVWVAIIYQRGGELIIMIIDRGRFVCLHFVTSALDYSNILILYRYSRYCFCEASLFELLNHLQYGERAERSIAPCLGPRVRHCVHSSAS